MSLILRNNSINQVNYNKTETIYKNSKDKKLIVVDNPSNSHFPGLAELIFAPITIFYTVPELLKAGSKRDMEGTLDAILRLSRANFSFAYAFMMASSYVTQIFSLYEISLIKHLHILACPILGLVLSSLETLYEGWSLKKIIQFKNQFYLIKSSTNYSIGLPKSEKNKLLKKDIKFLSREYFHLRSKEKSKIEKHVREKLIDKPLYVQDDKINEISETLVKIKKNDLARRVRPWLVEEIDMRLPKILENIKDPNPEIRKKAIHRAQVLMQELDTQCQKRILIHILGIVALTFTIAAFILALAGAPFLTITFLFVVATLVGLSRYALAKGYLDSRGWKFRIENFPPERVMTIFEKLYQKTYGINFKERNLPLLTRRA